MSIHQIRLYDLFRKELYISDEKAADFVLAVENIAGLESDTKNRFLEVRDNIHSLEVDSKKQLIEIKDKIHALNIAIKDDIRFLDVRIEQSMGGISKAMFWTGVVQIMTILGGVLAIAKFMK